LVKKNDDLQGSISVSMTYYVLDQAVHANRMFYLLGLLLRFACIFSSLPRYNTSHASHRKHMQSVTRVKNSDTPMQAAFMRDRHGNDNLLAAKKGSWTATSNLCMPSFV
jgi:hypothetical protein